jgi:hypothetical protein
MGIFNGSVPGASHGSFFMYNITAELDGGRTLGMPVGAPSAWFTVWVRADTLPPSVTHTPPDLRQVSFPALITAQASDNQGISNVVLTWQKNGTPQSNRTMNYDPVAGFYYTYLPSGRSTDLIEYKITATDVSLGALRSSSPSSGMHSITVRNGFIDPIGPVDYFYTIQDVASSRLNQWHKSSHRNNSSIGGYSYKFGGDGGSQYGNNAQGALVLGPVRLSVSSALSFNYYIDTEYDTRGAWDGGIVEISTNAGSNWTRIAPSSSDGMTLAANRNRTTFYPGGGIPVYGGTRSWTPQTVNLSSYSGEVYIRFHFGSDGYVTGEAGI